LRIYDIISSPALISLRGFRVTRSRISLELSPLRERRVRNQELVTLRKKEKKQDMTYKSTENKENKKQNFQVIKTHTFGKGWPESKKFAVRVWISFSLVRVVKDLTNLSISFFSGSWLDTRGGSSEPV
jgi:hypothetical protein